MKLSPTLKKLVYLVVLMIIVVIGYGLYLQLPLSQKVETPTLTACSEIIDILEPTQYTIEEDTDVYVVSVKADMPKNPLTADRIKKDIQAQVDGLKITANEIYADFPESITRPYSITMKGEATIAKNILNYKLTSYVDTGGAHGMPSFEILVIPLSSNSTNPLTISNIISTPEAFKAFVDQIIIPKIITQLPQTYSTGSDFYNEKTLREFLLSGSDWLNNFEGFSVKDEGISFTFSAYSVGPYSEGEPEILIPWDTVLPVLSQEFISLLNTCK